MSTKNDTWMPLYIGDYLADTSRLSTEGHGAYLLILMDYWRNGPPLDDDEELANIAKLSQAQWRKHAPRIRPLFDSVDGYLIQKRADKERTKAGLVSSIRSQAGKDGASKRWGEKTATAATTRSQRLAEARAKGRHTKDEWDALQFATGYRCVCCGIAASDLEGGVLTKDHIVPIYQGGDDSIENIQPACRNCNSRKGSDRQDNRETHSNGWRKRMTERLANAWQTPGPSPSQPQSQDSTVFTLSPSFGGDQVETEVFTPTPAGVVCKALKQAGVASVNPSNQALLALLEAGATTEEFVAAAAKASDKSRPFEYLLTVVQNERERVKQMAGRLHQGAMPTKAPTAAELRVLEAVPGIAAPHLRQQQSFTEEVFDVTPQRLG